MCPPGEVRRTWYSTGSRSSSPRPRTGCARAGSSWTARPARAPTGAARWSPSTTTTTTRAHAFTKRPPRRWYICNDNNSTYTQKFEHRVLNRLRTHSCAYIDLSVVRRKRNWIARWLTISSIFILTSADLLWLFIFF